MQKNRILEFCGWLRDHLVHFSKIICLKQLLRDLQKVSLLCQCHLFEALWF